MKHLGLILISLAVLQGCNYNEAKKSNSDSSETLLNVSDETTISYEFVSSKVTASCTHCHQELSSKQALAADPSAIMSEVISNRMPKDRTPLSDCQKAILQKWYDLGAPDDSEITIKSLPECALVPEPTATPQPTPTPEPTPTPTPVVETMITYDLINTQTAAVCLKCHSPGGKKPDLSTQAGYLDNAVDVMSEVMTNSMPKKNPPLTDCAKATLQKWLELGAPTTSQVSVESLPECKLP